MELRVHSRPIALRKDAFGGILACDAEVELELGWRASDLIGQRSLDFIHPDDHDNTVASWLEMLECADTFRASRYRHSHADGSWMHVEVTSRNELDREGCVSCSLVVLGRADGKVSDVDRGTSEIQAIRTLRSGERLLRRLADGLPTGVAYINSSGIVTYANLQCRQLLDIADGAIIDDLLHRLDPASRSSTKECVQRTLGSDAELVVNAITDPVEGASRSLQLSLRGLAESAEGPGGVIFCVDDTTEQVHAVAELEWRASVDSLTGCLNRFAVFAALESALEAGEHLAVVFVDVDCMKDHNDSLGHAAGDLLLIETAERLRGAIRPEDFVGRIGGDEFVAVCRNVPTREAALLVVARVADAMSWTFHDGCLDHPVSASVGAAHANKELSAAESVARADVAMYTAKRSDDAASVLWNESTCEIAQVPGQQEFMAL